MKRRITLRPAAEKDLDEQAEYLAAHPTLATGVRFYFAVEKTFSLLASRPEMGRLARFESPVLAGLRVFYIQEFPRHLVFYRSVKNSIEIVRVLHGARDIENLVGE